jgi:hypothetical protein
MEPSLTKQRRAVERPPAAPPRRRTLGDRLLRRVVNPVVRRLLASPVHDLVGESTVLVGFRGRRTGRELSTPANAVVDGDVLTLTSRRRRAWWRNLRGGAPVSITVGGRAGERFPTPVRRRSPPCSFLSTRPPGIRSTPSGRWPLPTAGS